VFRRTQLNVIIKRSTLDSINLERFHCQNQFLSSSETFCLPQKVYIMIQTTVLCKLNMMTLKLFFRVLKPVIHTYFRITYVIINGTLEIPLTPFYTLLTNKMPHTNQSLCKLCYGTCTHLRTNTIQSHIIGFYSSITVLICNYPTSNVTMNFHVGGVYAEILWRGLQN
jgi:hypothetical protein